jgi:phosphoribosyl-ATP pyrophosphohydrolase
MAFTLEQLDERVLLRATASPDESYTARMVALGVKRCAQKFGEEAVEAVVAAAGGDKGELIGEAADTLFHLLILLHVADVPLDAVMVELEARTRQSGLQEKASRGGAR